MTPTYYQDSTLYARRCCGGLLVWTNVELLDSAAKKVDVILLPGDTFGGRSYVEWQTIADDAGHVDADWLNV